MCAYSVVGGATRQKIELDDIIRESLDELRTIESSNSTQSDKTRSYKRLALKIKTALHDDGRKNDGAKIALTTYKRYLTKVRNAIKAAGYTHHSLKDTKALAGTISRVQKDFPEYTNLLEPIRTESANTLGALVHSVLEHIRSDKTNKNRASAYSAVKAMKTDHEILYHLKMDEVQRADVEEQQSEALETKKTNTVKLTYADIHAIISEGVKSTAYSKQAVALALACGRRAIEILHNAEFIVTGEHTVLFAGQAKKRSGIDADAFEIYTLIPAIEFVAAFEKFRAHESVSTLINECKSLNKEAKSTLINKRTAKTLNEAAKSMLNNNTRSFKDTRSIYARVCLDKYWDKSTDEDAFVTRLMGHDDEKAQAHYKQFIVDYSAERGAYNNTNNTEFLTPKNTEEEAKAIAKATRKATDSLQAITNTIDTFVNKNPTRTGLANYHKKVIAWVAINPTLPITKSALVHKVGGNRKTIEDYLLITEDALKGYNDLKK